MAYEIPNDALWGAQQHFKGLAWTGVPLGLEKKRVPVICDFKGIYILKHFKVIPVACQLFSLACSFCTQILRIHYHSPLHRSLHAFLTVSVMMYHMIFPFESYCFVSGQDNTTLEPARKYENYHPCSPCPPTLGHSYVSPSSVHWGLVHLHMPNAGQIT